jgi:hypothetical protein
MARRCIFVLSVFFAAVIAHSGHAQTTAPADASVFPEFERAIVQTDKAAYVRVLESKDSLTEAEVLQPLRGFLKGARLKAVGWGAQDGVCGTGLDFSLAQGSEWIMVISDIKALDRTNGARFVGVRMEYEMVKPGYLLSVKQGMVQMPFSKGGAMRLDDFLALYGPQGQRMAQLDRVPARDGAEAMP